MTRENYFVVFTINTGDPKGREIASIIDKPDARWNEKHIRGFFTKAEMKRFAEEFKSGFNQCKMLKPIS